MEKDAAISEAGPYTNEHFFEQFLRLSVSDGSASSRTIRTYRDNFKAYLEWCYHRSISPRLATVDAIQEYRADLGRTVKPATARLRLRAVRILYQALQRWGQRADNPADGIRAAKDQTHESVKVLKKCLSPEEAYRFWNRAHFSSVASCRDWAIIGLLLWQGMRAEEVCDLQLTCIEGDGCHSLVFFGKGMKERIVSLAKPAQEALIKWMRFRRLESLEQTYVFHPLEGNEFPLFPLEGKLSVRTIERIVDRELKISGLKEPGRSAHALRHTYAVLSVLGGAQREAIADSMGHSSLRTTDIYTRAASIYQSNPAEGAWKAAQDAALSSKPQPREELIHG